MKGIAFFLMIMHWRKISMKSNGKVQDNEMANSLFFLGDAINNTWKKHGFRQNLFPEIATELLKKEFLHKKYQPDDVINLALSPHSFLSSYQANSLFGDLQQVVYKTDRFYIEVLYWVDGLTSIHDHAFSGAFLVMSGGSINVEYNFKLKEEINANFIFGELTTKTIKKLVPGDVVPIYSGNQFIHSVFHLSNPTVSIVVRTFRDNNTTLQLDYRGRHLALVESISPILIKKIQALRFLQNGKFSLFISEFYKAYLGAAIDERYWLLRAFYRFISEKNELLTLINKSDDPELSILVNVLNDEAGQSALINLRNKVQQADLKYFLAVLINLPNWVDINKYIHETELMDCFSFISGMANQLSKIDSQFPEFKVIESMVNFNKEKGVGLIIPNKDNLISNYLYQKYKNSK